MANALAGKAAIVTAGTSSRLEERLGGRKALDVQVVIDEGVVPREMRIGTRVSGEQEDTRRSGRGALPRDEDVIPDDIARDGGAGPHAYRHAGLDLIGHG